MPLSDYGGMSDRDILIAVAMQQEHLANDFLKFSDTQEVCNVSIDVRVKDLEVNGSKVSRDLSTALRVVDNRLIKVEKASMATDTELTRKQTWIDSLWAKIGIISGIVLGVIAFLKGVFS